MNLTRDITSHPTLSEFANSEWVAGGCFDGLDVVIQAIALGARAVNSEVRAAGLAGVLGSTGEVNVHGEMVQYLDELGSNTFVNSLSKSGRVAAVVCEEIEDPVLVSNRKSPDYVVFMDPLDGSSNIDVAVSIGSIFGIWPHQCEDVTLMRPGNEQIAAAYVVYGSSTVLVVATDRSVQGFTLDSDKGEFYLTDPDITMPDKCQYYSTNEGNLKLLDNATQAVLASLRDKYSLRYVGSLVADFHRNLLKGGIFLYPADQKSPEGKLRLMYEANPLGFVAVQAGGAASSGYRSVLSIKPDELHQRTPLIIGNKDVVEQTVANLTAFDNRNFSD